MSQSTPIYQVSELVNEMRQLMETSYPVIWIEGEISSLSAPASGHIYFTLKDELSQIRCAMFRSRVKLNRYRAKTGDLVRVRARISVYTARGELQCIVQHIEDAGEGVLQRRFEELRDKLNSQGLFNASHKQQLPAFPRNIGLITSPTGAAVKDVLTTLERRCPGIPVTLYAAVVQGDGAAATLVQAINDAVQHNQCDVIIIGRGGGSLEDLWCFNDESLANAIFNCPIPIVSAVGHEIDTTIADYVADLRAPTPTAAAELLSPDNTLLLQQLASVSQRIENASMRYFEKQGQRVDLSFQQLQHPKSTIQINRNKLAHTAKLLQMEMFTRLRNSSAEVKQYCSRFRAQPPRKRILLQSENLRKLSDRLIRNQRLSIKSSIQQFDALGSQLHLVSPLATLDRGFSITRDKNDAILRDSKSTSSGDELSIELKSGKLLCEVREVSE